jgi:colanic acid/amylovoran biosynthesis glycosyltransferase
LKIAYFINQYPKVSHTFIRREILALERQGFQVLRIALRGWDETLPDPQDRRERNLTWYVLRRGVFGLVFPTLRAALRSPLRLLEALRLARRMHRTIGRPLAYHLVCVAEACRVARWTRDFGASRIHAHFGTNSAEIVMLAEVLGGAPYSFTVHGTDEFMRPMGLEEKIHRASFVVAVSSFIRSQLYMLSRRADWDKIKVAHCGIEREFYSGQLAPVPATPRLICVGRIYSVKGQLLLIEAAARLAAEGVSFELVLAGDGPQRSAAEQLIRKYGLEDRIRITGWISSAQVREEILAARALVLPSFSEGLPVAVMEAMALRRPVLATYVAGVPELVSQGESGWLFPAGSVEALAEAMRDCLAKRSEEIRGMGDAAYARVIERHSIDTETGKLARLFRLPVLVDERAGYAPTYRARQS